MKITSFADFDKDSNPYKYWKIKDTYFSSPITSGNWWGIKRYIVIYLDLLVSGDAVNDDVIAKIENNFSKFVNSISDPTIKAEAEKFFLSNINKNSISFKAFNDLGHDYEYLARAFYAARIMDLGGQGGLNKCIKEWLNENKTMKQIMDLQDIKKDFVIKNGIQNSKGYGYKVKENGGYVKYNGIVVKGGNKRKASGTLNDFPAALTRNNRQVYSKLGVLPHDSDGLSGNRISELIYKTDNELILNAICDHQKIKMRIGNPDSDTMINYGDDELKNSIIQYKKSNYAHKDFKANPFISLIKIFNELIKCNDLEKYVSVYEYQHIISKLAPFDLNQCISLIRSSRKNNIDVSDKREKKREISDKKPAGGFHKPLHNLLYGLMTKSDKKNDLRKYNKNAFIEYKSRKYQICNEEKFKIYYSIIKKIDKHLNNTNKGLYNKISKDYEKQLIDEFNSIIKNPQDNFSNKLYTKYSYKDLDSIESYLQSWAKYIQSIDDELLEFCIDLNKVLMPYEIKNPSKIHSKLKLSSKNHEITQNSVIKYLMDRSTSNLYDGENLKKDRKEFEKEKKLIKVNRAKGLYHEKKFPLRREKLCDSCDSATKLELHHIIPHEFDGPDYSLNLVFLCKKCHNSFTFNTKEKSQDNSRERSKVIHNLKLNSFLKRENFEKMINSKLVKKIHLDFLVNTGYINYIEWLDLKKILNRKQKTYNKKSVVSDRFSNKGNDRWGRAMKEIFELRIEHNIINGKVDNRYPILECDGGCGKLIEKSNNRECHHIIPKIGSTNKHFISVYGKEPFNGPESEFNYLYLCKHCHLQFTNHTEKRKEIIKIIKKNKIVSYETVLNLIHSYDIKIRQIDFLKSEGFIDKDDYDNLKKDLKKFKENQF